MDFKELFFRKLTSNWHKSFDKIGISAEGLTIFRVLFGLAAIYLFYSGTYLAYILFLLAYQLVFLVDYVDGRLARLQKRFSFKWLYFDRIAHYVITFLFLLVLNLKYPNIILLYVSLISVLVFSFIGVYDTFRNYKHSAALTPGSLRETAFGFFIIEAPFSLFFFGVLFRLYGLTLLLYSIFYTLAVIYKLIIIAKKRKK
jgi:phosphatidylglycerophosphate synthase